MADTETYTVESPDGDTDTFDLPAGLVDVLSEQGDEKSTVVADIAVVAFAQRAHSMAHHAQGEVPEDIEEIAADAEEIFEDRLGISFADAMGHDH
jgi:hypothetical protein